MMRYLVFFLVLGCNSVVLSETLLEANALQKMEGAKNWPVVDIRELSDRSQSPIPGALEFGPELSLEGKALLVASDITTALLVARSIESRTRTAEVFVLVGGFETLRTIRPELSPSIGDFIMPGTFTIPSDTCKQGEPLHTFSDEEEK